MRKHQGLGDLIEPADRLVFLRPHVRRSDKFFNWFLILGGMYFAFHFGLFVANY